MNFKEKVRLYLQEKKDPDRVAGGYKAIATRLSRELDKNITPAQVKRYLKSKEKELKKEGKFKHMEKGAKKATKPGAYKWGYGGSMYQMALGHFKK